MNFYGFIKTRLLSGTGGRQMKKMRIVIGATFLLGLVIAGTLSLTNLREHRGQNQQQKKYLSEALREIKKDISDIGSYSPPSTDWAEVRRLLKEVKKDVNTSVTTSTSPRVRVATPTYSRVGNKNLLPVPTPYIREWKNLRTQIVQRIDDVPDITKMDKYSVVDLAVYVAAHTGVPAEYILCLLWVESNFFKNTGSSGKGISDGHINRDAILFYALCVRFGYNPCDMPASQSARRGYGGAIGGAQVLPSTVANMSGWSIEFEEIFSNSHRYYSRRDALYIQRKINRHFRKKVVSIDGSIGMKSREWIVRYLQQTLDNKCLPKNLEHCVKDPGFVKTLFTIQNGYLLQYKPSRDKVATALRKNGPQNPFDSVVSTAVGALLLKENKVTTRPQYARGAYFAGPANAYSRWARAYTKKHDDVFVWACQEVRSYYRTKGWRIRT